LQVQLFVRRPAQNDVVAAAQVEYYLIEHACRHESMGPVRSSLPSNLSADIHHAVADAMQETNRFK
jgi:hypothetical protein